MGKGQGSLRRTAGIGAFVAIVMLALSLPSIAFAANTTIFRSLTPKAGSSTSVTKPKISVVCYDKYGVKRASRTSMTLDGVKVAKTLTWYRGWHHKKFKLTYKVRSALSLGSHKVVVRVVDRRHKRSRKTWRFTVVDRTPPVTTSDAARGYTGSATIHLSATDNVGGSGVAHTYYKLDDGARTEGAAITVSVVGVHTLEFWSVDAQGNAESRHVVSFRVRTTHTVSGPCFNAGCHSTDVTVIHSAWANPPGCAACHGAGKTPSLDCATCHSNIGTVHGFAHANASGTKSTACTACHGTDLPTVHIAKGCVCHTASFLVGEMTTLLAAGKAECVDCHKGDHAAHGFDMTASGHNTTTYGKKGPYTKFDSSQGPLLKTTADTTVTNTWEFPTVNVFWPANDPSATTYAETGLTASSVVTCQDCHTGLNASGPHGASDNWGIDPNYPYPYDLAVLSHATVALNGFSPVGGIMERVSQTDTTSPARQAVPGTPTGVICQKCHKLFDGTGLTGLSGTSNTAHGSHHYVGGPGHSGNQTLVPDGSNDCVSCHVAIPHGWKRPRLLINTGIIAAGTGVPAGTVVDTAPYVDPNIRGRWINSTVAKPIAGYTPPYLGFAGVGMGPLSSTDQHSLDASGAAVWTEANCIACGAEHTGVPADTAKVQ